jgi:hypothetical protein
MPCYDGREEDTRRDRETAKKVEAVLCGVIRAFGFDNVLDSRIQEKQQNGCCPQQD